MRRKIMLGIMQGRFTERGGFYPQQFPWNEWEDEFRKAKMNGIECIEWMFNEERFCENPVWTKSGRKQIREMIESSDVKLSSICANFFMRKSLCEAESMEVVKHLIEAGTELGIRQIVFPLFGESNPSDLGRTANYVAIIAEFLEKTDVQMCIECDLPVMTQKEICSISDSDKVGICYDTGNAAGNGSDCAMDVAILGKYLFELHIKDKLIGGESVMLGYGSVEFERIFRILNPETKTLCVLESYFGSEAEKDTIRNIQYVKKRMKEQGLWH